MRNTFKKVHIAFDITLLLISMCSDIELQQIFNDKWNGILDKSLTTGL